MQKHLNFDNIYIGKIICRTIYGLVNSARITQINENIIVCDVEVDNIRPMKYFKKSGKSTNPGLRKIGDRILNFPYRENLVFDENTERIALDLNSTNKDYEISDLIKEIINLIENISKKCSEHNKKYIFLDWAQNWINDKDRTSLNIELTIKKLDNSILKTKNNKHINYRVIISELTSIYRCLDCAKLLNRLIELKQNTETVMINITNNINLIKELIIKKEITEWI